MSEHVATFELVSAKSDRMIATREFRLGHRRELDGLRGISILMVLLLHLGFNFMRGGFIGVDVFFVLSGFLITSLLIQESDRQGFINLKAFYVRRALRLGPALVVYIVGLALSALVFMREEQANQINQGILLTLSYVSNWIFALRPSVKIGPLGVTWSLAIEEQFYLVWPLILSLVLRFKVPPRTTLYALILGAVLVMWHRRILWEGGALTRRLYYATDTRADALLIGCAVALLLASNLIPQTKAIRRTIKAAALFGLPFIMYIAVTFSMRDERLYQGLLTLVSLAIGAILIDIMLWPSAWALSLLRLPPLVWIGRISYGLYLWHWPIREMICPDIQSSPTWRVVATAVISIAVAALSFHLIEQRFLRLKERFKASGRSSRLEVDEKSFAPADCQTSQA